MEINLDSKTVPVFRELSYQTNIIQEICESVVPDTDEDISELAVVDSSVFLKSKDITSRGVLVTGEVCASLIYITESRDKSSSLKLKRAFSMEFDITDINPETVSQVYLHLSSAEARLINPRKVSVCFEIAGDLSCYVMDALSVEYGLPNDACEGLHAKYETVQHNCINAVCEKSFSLNEQFTFPNGKPRPVKLVSAKTEIIISDTQFVGTKVIVKGAADISLSYFSDEVNYPIKSEFSTGFSQVVDVGEAAGDSCSVTPVLTGIYYNIADSVGGDKLFDIELHTLLQLVCRRKCEIVYVADAYSNLMPAICNVGKNKFCHVAECRKVKISEDNRLDLGDGCVDILSLNVSVSKICTDQEKIASELNLDIVYKNKAGLLASQRRILSIKTEAPAQDYRICSARLLETYMRPDGQFIDCRISVEIGCVVYEWLEIDRVSSVSLNEEASFELDKLPTVTLVHCTGETVWELAKTYHSSVEKISENNDMETALDGRMILVPKCK